MNSLRSAIAVALLLTAVGLLASCATPYTQRPEDAAFYAASEAVAHVQASARVQAEIERTWEEHIEAAREKDLHGVMEIYADDIAYFVSGEELHGRAAMDAHEKLSLSGADVHDGVEHVTIALTAHGDVAYELGTIVGPVRVHGQATRVVTFSFTARWVRADGAWKLQHLVGDASTD